MVPEPKEDEVVLTVSDMNNNGCTNESWKPGRTAVFASHVLVTDFDDQPSISLYKYGKDVCLEACAHAGTEKDKYRACCDERNVLEATEDETVAFGKEVAIMYDSPEFLNFEFPDYKFRTTVLVKHGILKFPKFDDPNEPLWYPAGCLINS